MKTTRKDRREHELLRYLKADRLNLTDHECSELRKQFQISTPDFHAAIRLTSSVRGSADCSRSSYRHYIRIEKARKLKRITLKELNDEIQGNHDHDR